MLRHARLPAPGSNHVVVSVRRRRRRDRHGHNVGTVVDRNRPPTATAATVDTPEDTPLAVTLHGDDPDGDRWPSRSSPRLATASLTGAGADRTYTPAPNYHGPDTFTFAVSDGQLTPVPATVAITVTPVNDPPIANPASVTAVSGAGHRDRPCRAPTSTATRSDVRDRDRTDPRHVDRHRTGFTLHECRRLLGHGFVRRSPSATASCNRRPVTVTIAVSSTSGRCGALCSPTTRSRTSNVRSLGRVDAERRCERLHLRRPGSGDQRDAAWRSHSMAVRSRSNRAHRTTSPARHVVRGRVRPTRSSRTCCRWAHTDHGDGGATQRIDVGRHRNVHRRRHDTAQPGGVQLARSAQPRAARGGGAGRAALRVPRAGIRSNRRGDSVVFRLDGRVVTTDAPCPTT